jgi:hypothetical protein
MMALRSHDQVIPPGDGRVVAMVGRDVLEELKCRFDDSTRPKRWN